MDARTEARRHYCVFATSLGSCGIAWSSHGVTRFSLPHASRSATEQRVGRGAVAGAPPPHIAAVIADAQRYFTGEAVEFASVAVDLPDVAPFDRRVYDAARALDWGCVASYGDLARQIGAPTEAREVGQALGRNPIPLIIPCHRIVATGGKLGGFSAPGGAATKERLLALEGVRVGVPADEPLLPGF